MQRKFECAYVNLLREKHLQHLSNVLEDLGHTEYRIIIPNSVKFRIAEHVKCFQETMTEMNKQFVGDSKS